MPAGSRLVLTHIKWNKISLKKTNITNIAKIVKKKKFDIFKEEKLFHKKKITWWKYLKQLCWSVYWLAAPHPIFFKFASLTSCF